MAVVRAMLRLAVLIGLMGAAYVAYVHRADWFPASLLRRSASPSVSEVPDVPMPRQRPAPQSLTDAQRQAMPAAESSGLPRDVGNSTPPAAATPETHTDRTEEAAAFSREADVDEIHPPARLATAPALRANSSFTAQPPPFLAEAREAFRSGDYVRAEQLYRQAAERAPKDPDPAGELGNMLLSQQQWKPAAAAFHQAALRLLDQGRVGQAMYLLTVIRDLDSNSAADLEQRIAAARDGSQRRASPVGPRP